MFKNTKLGTKITLGFSLLLVLSLVMGLFAWQGLKKVLHITELTTSPRGKRLANEEDRPSLRRAGPVHVVVLAAGGAPAGRTGTSQGVVAH